MTRREVEKLIKWLKHVEATERARGNYVRAARLKDDRRLLVLKLRKFVYGQ